MDRTGFIADDIKRSVERTEKRNYTLNAIPLFATTSLCVTSYRATESFLYFDEFLSDRASLSLFS
jgi:hypothetical protein